MKVLVGIDGSETSFRALEAALDRAREAGDELTVAVVHDEDTDPPPDEIERRVRDVLSAADVDATIRHAAGHPASQLVDLADGEDFDRLVIHGGERSPMGKIKLGSTAEFVLLNARTSVTLIR